MWNVTATQSPNSICLIPYGGLVLCLIPWAIILWKEWFMVMMVTSLLNALKSIHRALQVKPVYYFAQDQNSMKTICFSVFPTFVWIKQHQILLWLVFIDWILYTPFIDFEREITEVLYRREPFAHQHNTNNEVNTLLSNGIQSRERSHRLCAR